MARMSAATSMSSGNRLDSVPAMLEGVPVTLRSTGVCFPVHPAPAIRHCCLLVRLPGRPAVGTISRTEVHSQFARHGIDSPISRDPHLPEALRHPPPPGLRNGRGHAHRHLLLALTAVAVERFEQRGMGAGKLIRLGKVFAPALASCVPNRGCAFVADLGRATHQFGSSSPATPAVVFSPCRSPRWYSHPAAVTPRASVAGCDSPSQCGMACPSCNPCVRYELEPMSRAAQSIQESAFHR
jgi:hypothetical protein